MIFFGLGISENDRCLNLVDDTKFEVYGSTISTKPRYTSIYMGTVQVYRESIGFVEFYLEFVWCVLHVLRKNMDDITVVLGGDIL
jgi:hypothetical protein